MTDTIKTQPFDIAEHLETEDDIRAFLQETADTGNPAELIHALNIAARAKGMSDVATQAGVTRASLYKSLAVGGNPSFETVCKVAAAFGCRLRIG